MADFYGRDWYVILGDQKISGLRIRFKAEKGLAAEPNVLDLSIYNLARETRAKMQSRDIPVIVVAGYKTGAQVIFSGEVRTVDHVREGADWNTHVQSGDGEIAFRGCFSSYSFAPGTSWRDVATTIAKDLKVNVGDAVAKMASGNISGTIDSFLQGYSAHGPTVREVDRVMRAGGLEWSIQDGKLQVLPQRATSDEPAIVLSAGTGMVGSPDHCAPQKDEPAVLKVKSLLQGGLRPGRAVSIQASKTNGLYRCTKVVHVGDTHGAEWYTTIEAEPL